MKITDSTANLVKNRQRWLDEALSAQEFVSQLPLEILNIESASVDVDCDGGIYTINYYKASDLNELLIKWMNLGATFSGRKINEYSGNFKIEGSTGINQAKVEININSLEAPPNCKVVKKSVPTYQYESICNEEQSSPSLIEATEKGGLI